MPGEGARRPFDRRMIMDVNTHIPLYSYRGGVRLLDEEANKN